MDSEMIRPIVSGIIGAGVSVWMLTRLARWVPAASGDKSAETLLSENRTRILIANCLFFIGIGGAVAVYYAGYLPDNDWRGAALGFGFACVAPVMFLYFSALSGGALRIREAFVAYAISHKTPPFLLYGIWFLGFIAFFGAVASFVGR